MISDHIVLHASEDVDFKENIQSLTCYWKYGYDIGYVWYMKFESHDICMSYTVNKPKATQPKMKKKSTIVFIYNFLRNKEAQLALEMVDLGIGNVQMVQQLLL